MAKYDIAAYIWPSYTGDEPRSRIFWPEGYGEWQTIRAARAKFQGHLWPRKPLWGYCNEADPMVMEMQIDAAVSHGVNTFIYDWYWYDDRPFLENCLNDGFLKAKNRADMRFFLMWANHDATYLWDKRNSHDHKTVVWRGDLCRAQFERAMERIMSNYFPRPEYYRIDGRPVLMIYDVANLVKGLGGAEATKDALSWLKEKSGAHLQFTMWNDSVRAGGLAPKAFHTLGFDSCTHYQYCHFADVDRPYPEVLSDAVREWERLDGEMPVPYFPHISLGWDNNPRFEKFMPGIIRDCTPENIERAFLSAREFLDARPSLHKLITVNSWNEWTEGSYLEPDELNGYGYLQAIKNVFCGE